jgi:beta-phosphoglucomutase-like phosphatase (HAD superfamily)
MLCESAWATPVLAVKLAIFDVDGTLTSTNKLNDEAYLTALLAGLHLQVIDRDSSSYRQVTDPGILDEVFGTQSGHMSTVEQVVRFGGRGQG